MLRIGIVADAAAQMPLAFLKHPKLAVLPVKLQIDDSVFLDQHEPTFTSEFNRQYLNIRAAEVSKSVSMTEPEIAEFYLRKLALDFDHVIGLFVMSTRSPLFKNASNAASRTINESLPLRMQHKLAGPLLVEAHDSGSVMDGYGVLVMHTLAALDAGQSPTQVRNHIHSLRDQAYTYVAPSQLDFIATRAKARGDKSAGAMAIAAAKLLGLIPIVMANKNQTGSGAKVRGVGKARDHVIQLARRELQRGLLAPYINASFSGDTAVVEALPHWRALVQEAREHRVAVHLAEMTPTASINMGPDALSIGFVAQQHSPEL